MVNNANVSFIVKRAPKARFFSSFLQEKLPISPSDAPCFVHGQSNQTNLIHQATPTHSVQIITHAQYGA